MGGIRAVRLHRWSALAEVALLACCTPVAIGAMGQGSQALLAVDASYFAARVAATLAFDLHDSKTSVSRLSIVDALDALPEGVMWVSERGEVLFMNDAMRGSLTSLGLATDLADARGLWGRLESHARQAAHDRLIIETDPQTVRLFVRDAVALRNRRCRRIMALDVTEEATLNARLESVNRLLEAANEELRASMLQVKRVAEEEAVMRMRTRVHDTVGSRLSILHRYLEDGREDPQTLEKVTGLLSSIVDDLAEPSRPAASAGLASICNAFSLVGVEVRVTGELPADEAVACVFAEIVLEAVTNAAKHAQAAHVDVRLGGGGHGEASLVVTNDGGVPDAIVEGTGIPGMRQMATAVGATFSVSVGPPFAVEVTLPPRDVPGNSSERILPETQNERGHQ
jgi:signal transduction histidine kinase